MKSLLLAFVRQTHLHLSLLLVQVEVLEARLCCLHRTTIHMKMQKRKGNLPCCNGCQGVSCVTELKFSSSSWRERSHDGTSEGRQTLRLFLPASNTRYQRSTPQRNYNVDRQEHERKHDVLFGLVRFLGLCWAHFLKMMSHPDLSGHLSCNLFISINTWNDEDACKWQDM